MKREIPIKNYIILIFILLATIVLVTYLYMLNEKKIDEKLNTPILNEYMQVINYNELNNYLIENEDAIMYTSILGNKKIKNFEMQLKNIIKRNEFKYTLLYLDLTSEIKNRKIVNEMDNIYVDKEHKLSDIPSIMIYRNGKISSIYNIEKDNYNVKEVENYLESSGVIYD